MQDTTKRSGIVGNAGYPPPLHTFLGHSQTRADRPSWELLRRVCVCHAPEHVFALGTQHCISVKKTTVQHQCHVLVDCIILDALESDAHACVPSEGEATLATPQPETKLCPFLVFKVARVVPTGPACLVGP